MTTLNTVFKQKSNTMLNNGLFSWHTVGAMHETMKRLYAAAELLKHVTGQSAVARLLNASPQTVKNWEARGVSKQGMLDAEQLIGCRSSWVRTGDGDMADLSHSSDTQASLNVESLDPINIEQAPGLRGKVPLISFVQAGAFAETIDNFNPGDADEWIDATCPVNRHTFALRVVGDSMEPDFPAGTILIVEPELSPEPNDFVIAKNGDNEATFKQLTRDGADWYLKPLNPRYPIKPLGTSRVIGVVRDAVRKFR